MAEFLAETSDVLARTPRVVRELLAGIADSWTNAPDTDGGWRPRDVVGHLITAELDDWIDRTEHILDHGTSRPFPPFDRFAHVGRDDDQTLDQLVDRFVRLRGESLARLAELVSDDEL